MLSLALVISIAIAAPGAAIATDSGPAAVVEDLQGALLSLSDKAEERSFQERFQIMQPVVARSHDPAHIARLVTGRYWRNWTDGQQRDFQALFGELTVSLYAGQLAEFRGESFEVVEDAPQPRGIHRVSSVLTRADGDTLRFDFLLHQTASGWRIINIVVDGVSDLALRRSQYSKQLEEAGYDALLDDLRAELERLASES